MSINDLPVLSALRTKMQWHQERQRVLSENVSNSDTPNFKPRDLIEPKFDKTGAPAGTMGQLSMMRTTTGHIAPANGGNDSFDQNRKAGFETVFRRCGMRQGGSGCGGQEGAAGERCL